MPSRTEVIKRKLDAAKTRKAVIKEKVDSLKKYLDDNHGITTVAGARKLKAQLETKINKLEKEANDILTKVENKIEELEEEEMEEE